MVWCGCHEPPHEEGGTDGVFENLIYSGREKGTAVRRVGKNIGDGEEKKW